MERREPLLHILLRLGHIQLFFRYVPGGQEPLTLLFQPQQAPGMALRQSGGDQNLPAAGGEPQ